MFGRPLDSPLVPTKGVHRIAINGMLFEPESDVNVRLIVYGEVHGFAGTDSRRRDITVALLWGTPIALAFGLLAAVGTSITTMIIAAIGVWYGKWVDALIQRITEVNLILPILPVLVPGFVVSIPLYVFLEATLAALGLGDPILPTWGKLLDNARASGALYNGTMLRVENLMLFFRTTGGIVQAVDNVYRYTGKVFLGDTDVMAYNDETFRRRVRWVRIAMVPQAAMNALNPVIKIEEQVAEPLMVHGEVTQTEEAIAAPREVLATVGVTA